MSSIPSSNPYFEQIESALTDLAETISRDYDSLRGAAIRASEEGKTELNGKRTEEEKRLERAEKIEKMRKVFNVPISEVYARHNLSRSQRRILRAVLYPSVILGEDVRLGTDNIVDRLASGEITEFPRWLAFERLDRIKEHYRTGWERHENGIHYVLFPEWSSELDPGVKAVFMSRGDPVITSILGDTVRAVKTGAGTALESMDESIIGDNKRAIEDIINIGTAVTPDGLSEIHRVMGFNERNRGQGPAGR